MQYSRIKVELMQNLGTGLSVDSLCKKFEITYNDLCQLAQEHTDLYHELKRWYKRYDFLPSHNPLKSNNNTQGKPKSNRKKVV